MVRKRSSHLGRTTRRADAPRQLHAICSRETNVRAGEWIEREWIEDEDGEGCRCTHSHRDMGRKRRWFHIQHEKGSVFYRNPDGSTYYCWPEADKRWHTRPDPYPPQWSCDRMKMVPRKLPLNAFYGTDCDDPYEELMDPDGSDEDLGIPSPEKPKINLPLHQAVQPVRQMFPLPSCPLTYSCPNGGRGLYQTASYYHDSEITDSSDPEEDWLVSDNSSKKDDEDYVPSEDEDEEIDDE